MTLYGVCSMVYWYFAYTNRQDLGRGEGANKRLGAPTSIDLRTAMYRAFESAVYQIG